MPRIRTTNLLKSRADLQDRGKMEDSKNIFTQLGMVGMGSMGSMMSLLFAEHGCTVYYYDLDKENMDKGESRAEDLNLQSKVIRQSSYAEMCKSLESEEQPKLFIFSIPHGEPGDKCVEALQPHLKKGDIIFDCSNEHWENTERRQRQLEPAGVFYVGCGVSGGYQSARAGPSMSPGGPIEALKKLMPLLKTVAAKDKAGKPCTSIIGPDGSGHYIKMVHNGIEQGMLSVMSEVWFILTQGLGLSYEEVANIFEDWNKSGGLRDCFLVDIAIHINRTKDSNGEYVLAHVQDKVVQDVDNTEGTGVWTCEEAIRLHVPAPTILAAHLFRCASADLARRMTTNKTVGGGVKPSAIRVEDKDQFVNDLHKTTYFAFLICYAQGLNIIQTMDKERGWNLHYLDILQLWRGGCIIQADAIVDLLASIYAQGDHGKDDILSSSELASELSTSFSSVKNVVLKSVEADMMIPSISQSLEFYKYSTSTSLPTQLMEAQLDYFGEHMFDTTEEPAGKPVKGKHHYEWHPAKGLSDQ